MSAHCTCAAGLLGACNHVQSSRILKPLSAIMLVYFGIRSRNLQSNVNALSLILPVYATDVKNKSGVWSNTNKEF